MKARKFKEVYIEFTQENYKGLQKIARKNGLKWERVVDMILECEVGIIEHSAQVRRKLAKRLKIKPTRKFLYKPRFLGS